MIPERIQSQRDYFSTHETKSVAFRKATLKKLKSELILREQDIIDALYKDFRKPTFEAVITETEIIIADLNYTIKSMTDWTKPKRIRASLLNFPSSDYIYSEPYGVTLVISPWNYPYQLALAPLIAAVAAGNTVVVKPSELTPNTSAIIVAIIKTVFKPEHATVIEGGVATATTLLQQKWDYIFFTGSVNVGKIVAKAAATYLTPVTLELGGKNPCIVDETANIKLSAKRIVWGKFLNAGQTCIAPDYILIHHSIKQAFYEALKSEITTAYSKTPERSEDYARIINFKHFDRLKKVLANANCIIGGHTNPETYYIAPTVIDEPKLNSEVMKTEIFGPILPVISYQNDSKLEAIIQNYEKPLSFYIFSTNSKKTKQLIKQFSFGGGAINDTVIQFTNKRLPFGGVGASGLGAYHGKYGFNTFSHKKSIVKKGNWLDLPLRYAPFKGKLRIVKNALKWLS